MHNVAQLGVVCGLSVRLQRLKDSSLDLVDLAQVDVPDQKNPEERQNHDTSSSSQHPGLSVAISLLNSHSRGTANRVFHLRRQVSVDLIEVRHGRLREVSFQRDGEGIGPDSATNGGSHGTSDSTNNIEQSQGSRNVLMVDSGQDGKLLHNDEDRATDGDEDLTHHEIADGLVRATEVDHQALRENVERDRDVEHPLEATGLADQDSDEEQQNTRDDVECVRDISGFGDGQIVDSLQERCEVGVPCIEGNLVSGVQQTGTDDGAVVHRSPV